MSASLAPTESISKSMEGDNAVSKYVTDNTTNLEDIKEVDEDVQYQIAQAQSPLSASSKEAWQLCKIAPKTGSEYSH
jgi:predicted transcriptional regulator